MGPSQIIGGSAAIFDDEHVKRAVTTVSKARKHVAEQMAGMNSLRMVRGNRSNFFLPEILNSHLGSSVVFNGLLERGVILPARGGRGDEERASGSQDRPLAILKVAAHTRARIFRGRETVFVRHVFR